MSADQVERKLAAIFAADVEGYSRLMGIDEVATLRTLTGMALQQAPDFQNGLRITAVSNALVGKTELARKAITRLLQLHPDLRISSINDFQGPYQRTEDIMRYEEGMRRAGLPE